MEDHRLVQLALEHRYLTMEQVDRAKREQQVLADRGVERSLWFLLLELGFVSDVQLRDLRKYVSSTAIRALEVEGYVLQEIGLFPHLTVEENVALVPRLEGWPVERRRARAHDLLELVGLPAGEFGKRWPRELSGGQRQRVGVARALAIDPPILLMDEPFGALDSITRQELRNEFQRIRRHLRQTVIFVTHDMDEAFALGDRVGVLERGWVTFERPAMTR